MGGSQSSAASPLRLIDAEIELRRETRDFARWTLVDVAQLQQRFQKTHGLAMTESQLAELLLTRAPEAVTAKEIFQVLDANRDGRIDSLEFIAALTCVARASFEDKARFAFELFDFNRNGSLSQTELALLMKSVWMGMALFTGRAVAGVGAMGPPPVDTFIRLAQQAFGRYDRDAGGSLQYEEFVEWARSNRAFMLQVEQFRLISEKAVGFEETLSLPDGSDADSDLEEECTTIVKATTDHHIDADETRRPELPAPWLIEPSHVAISSPESMRKYDFPPPVNHQLDWIYGFHGAQCRDGLRVLATGDIVYAVSKYAIVYTSKTHGQRHYGGHKYPITCLDVNATSTIVATGDTGPAQRSEIHVWHGVSLDCLAVLGSFHVDGVTALRFPSAMSAQKPTPMVGTPAAGSGAGAMASAKKQQHAADTLLLSVGSDANSSMALWDWQHERLLASGIAISKRKRVLCVAVSEDGHEVLVGGEHFLVFHHVDGRFFKLRKPKGLEGKLQTMPICTSAAYQSPQHVVVGTARGTLLQFHHMQLVRVIQAHGVMQSINVSLLACRSMVLFTAGKDGMIRQWDSTLQPIGTAIDLHQCVVQASGLEDEDCRIHSLAYDGSSQRLLVGTRHGHLLELHENTHPLGVRVIAASHRGGGVQALASSRGGLAFVTGCRVDRSVRLWDMRRRCQRHRLKLHFPPNALVFSADGEFVAVGGADGSIALLRSKSLKPLSQMKNTQSSVVCLRFHPSLSSLSLAVACHNGLIYLYAIESATFKFHRRAVLKPTPAESADPVCSLDFSVDGRFLKSQHGKTALRFWELGANDASLVKTTATVRNVQWQTFTSSLGWHVSGLTRNAKTDGIVTVNSSQSAVTVLDPGGNLVTWTFPCVQNTGNELTGRVTGAHVVPVCPDATEPGDNGLRAIGYALYDTHLLSTSGECGSVVCQWQVIKELVDLQPRVTPAITSIEMRACLTSLGQDELYFRDPPGSYVAPRAGSGGAATPALVNSMSMQRPSLRRTEAPDLDLTLCAVYGFNYRQVGLNQGIVGLGHASGATMSPGSIVYGAGSLLVGHDMAHNKQQRAVVSGLTNQISSIVKHSDSIIAVGAQGDPRVLLWQWEVTPQQIGVLEAPPASGVTEHVLTAFYHVHGDSKARDLAAIVWKTTAGHELAFYNWRKQHTGALAVRMMTRLPVLFGCFVPVAAVATSSLNALPTSVGFVSGGVDHVTFWRFDVASGHVHRQMGVYGRHAIIETAICGSFAAPYVLTGTVSGTIVVWENGAAAYALSPPGGASRVETVGSGCVSPAAVISLVTLSTKNQVVVGRRDGQVQLFSFAKESDTTKYRPNAFLTQLQSINVFENPLLPMKTAQSKTSQGVNAGQETHSTTTPPIVGSVVVLDDLQNGVVAVLSNGSIVQVDGNSFVNRAKGATRVVVDIGEDILCLAHHPRDRFIALGHRDGRLSIHNAEQNTVEACSAALQSAIVAMAWHPSGKSIAASTDNGKLVVLSALALDIIVEVDCGASTNPTGCVLLKMWCWTVRFSSVIGDATSWLAAACRNYHIYVYRASDDGNKLDLVHDFAGHTAPIRSLDFTGDGKWLQSATSAIDLQLCRWSLSEATPAAAASTVADDDWASWTNVFAGPVTGVLEAFDGSVTALDRIRGQDPGAAKWDSKLPTMALGTNTGRLLLGWFPLPCGESSNSMFKEYNGFYDCKSMVTQIEFGADNTIVTSRAMCRDGSGLVLLWKTDYEEEMRQLERIDVRAAAAAAASTTASTDAPVNDLPLLTESSVADALYARALRRTDPPGGDEFTAVKPWLGAIREPSVIPATVASSGSSVPDTDLALEFVYGVNSSATGTRKDVFYADDTWEVVYSAAAFGIVYNTKTRTQLVNQGHQGQMISCLTVHPRGDLVVTGEIAAGPKKPPKLVAWDANSGSTIAEMITVHSRGITSIAFAPSGERIASIGLDDDHVLAVYSLRQSAGIQKFHLLAQMKTSKQPVYVLAFHNQNDEEIVTAGVKHILFWTLSGTTVSSSRNAGRGSSTLKLGDGACLLSMKKGLFGEAGSNAKILAAVYVTRQQQQTNVITGQQDGSLYVWRARQCVDVRAKAHSGAVHALVVDPKDTNVVYSAGQDGTINLWNSQLELLHRIDVEKLNDKAACPIYSSAIRSVSVREGRILFSTDGGDVAELVPGDVAAHHAKHASGVSYELHIQLRSHNRGELWGLAAHPAKLQFTTAGDDGSVRLWDAPTREMLGVHRAKGSVKLRAVAYSSDGSHIAVGTHDGQVLVLNETLETVVTTIKCASRPIAVIRYDPEGHVVAVGVHDQAIYIFDAHSYKQRGVCKGHSSTVSHLDFSRDGRVLQSTSNAGELLFWKIGATCEQIKSATAVRDTQWATWTLPYGWPVQGIWPPGSDGSDVNAVARSQDAQVIATGDDDGLIKLFAYPCVVPSGASRPFVGHASHVTNVVFTANDHYLLSTGGLDNAICQYKRIEGPRRSASAA